jgi:hypothetical protein
MKAVLWAAALVLTTCVGRSATAQAPAFDLHDLLVRAGDKVEAFFARAQSLVCTEIVSMQPLNSGLTAEGFARVVEAELRVAWEPREGDGGITEAQTRRQVLKVNGRPPRDDDHRSCTTPEQEDTETQPLSMLLTSQRSRYSFSSTGNTRIDDRPALMIDFREIAGVSVAVEAVEGMDDCIRYDVNGGLRGRIWIDAETYDVLRLDQRLAGMIDLRMPQPLARRPGTPMYMTLERADTSMRFERMTFSEPEESLVLPTTTTELRIMRGGGTPRLRTVTKYLNYKRFLTGSRVVG